MDIQTHSQVFFEDNDTPTLFLSEYRKTLLSFSLFARTSLDGFFELPTFPQKFLGRKNFYSPLHMKWWFQTPRLRKCKQKAFIIINKKGIWCNVSSFIHWCFNNSFSSKTYQRVRISYRLCKKLPKLTFAAKMKCNLFFIGVFFQK